MYGVINNALRDMVLRDFGDESWRAIAHAANVTNDGFVSMQTYDDAATYSLVDAVSSVLDIPAEECLVEFGKYWILEAAPKSYDNVLNATGSEIVAFVRNINSLHDRITTSFPSYVPPEFNLDHLQDDRYELRYLSTRQGLAPFVRGLLLGLGERFQCPIEILAEEQLPTADGEHWSFTLDISTP